MKRLVAFSLVLALGCGTTPEASPAPVAPPPAASPVADVVPAPATAAPEPVAVAPVAALEEVDLLHAVPARITVSSAYHDDASQIARIADGDLTTAWNSRTGDLVGSWIELSLPPEANVRAIAMTVGFTRTTDRSDLFTGNHRVSRVRVSRDGVVLGEHALDTSSQALVEIPVNGPGGALRIEVLATIPGTHEDWREVCVSEIRALGSATGQSAGSLVPGASVGAPTIVGYEGSRPVVLMPGDDAPHAIDPLPEDAEEEALEAREAAEDARGLCASLMDEWEGYSGRLMRPSGLDALRDRERAQLEAARTGHRTLFEHAVELFESVSPASAADARTRAAQTDSFWYSRREDFEALVRGCDAVMAPYPSEACEWAEQRTYTRLQEIIALAFQETLDIETAVELRENAEGLPLRGAALEAERTALTTATAFNEWLEHIHAGDWDDVHRGQRTALLGGTVPPGRIESDWARMRADLESAETSCAAAR